MYSNLLDMKKIVILFIMLTFFESSIGQETSKSEDSIPKISQHSISEQKSSPEKDSINRLSGKGKTNTYVIEYDFSTGYFNKNNQRIVVNTPVVFKIVNINRLAYNVTVKAKDSVIGVSQMEGVYDIFKKEQLKNIETQTKASDIKSPNIQAVTSVVAADFNKSEKENLKLKEIINKFINDLSSKSTINLSTENRTELDTILKSVSDIKVSEKLDDELVNHLEAQKKLTEIYLKIIDKYYTIITLSKQYLHIGTLINDPILTNKILSNNKNLKDNISDFEKNKTIYSDISLLINQFQSLYNAIKTNSEIGKSTNYGGVIKLNYISDNQNVEIIYIKDQIDKINFEKLREELVQLEKLVTSENINLIFEYVSYPIQPFQDVVIFEIDIKKKDTKNNLLDNSKKFSHKEFVRHGLRLDVSLGAAGSFHSDDYSYSVKLNQNNENVIIKSDKSIFTPSFVGFFTASRRSATHFAYGLSIGLGLSASEGSVDLDNFFVGPSLILGKYERITFSTGISVKNLPILNNGYKEGDIVPLQYSIDNVADNAYVAGFYLSLSYNITKGVKDNIKHMKSFY